MSGWMKFVLALLLAGVLGAVVWLLGDDGAEPESADLGSATTTHAAAPTMGLVPGAPPREAQPLEVATDVAARQPVDAEGVAGSAAVRPDAPQVRVTGRLVDASNRPVEGARVVAHLPGDAVVAFARDAGARPRPETRSQADGRFALAFDLPDGGARVAGFERRFGGDLLRLVAAHDAFVVLVHEVPEALHEGELDVGTLALAAGAGLRGRVVDEAGRPVAGADIEAQHVVEATGRDPFLGMFRSGLTGLYTRATSGTDGRFVVHGLEPGPAQVTARADGRRVGFVDGLELVAASTFDVGDIELPKGGAIAGRVLAQDGSPLEGATVRVLSMQRIVIDELADAPRPQLGQEWRLRVQTDADGWFELAGLGAGTYTVRVEKSGFAPSSTDNVPVGTRDFSTRMTALGELELLLVDARTRAPVDAARVVAMPRQAGPMFVVGEQRTVDPPPADGSRPGTYLVHDVGPGGVDLEISAPGYASLSAEGPGASSGARARLELALAKESVLAGVVVDGDGDGIAGARVLLSESVEPSHDPGEIRIERKISIGGDEDDVFPWKRAVADEQGRFELRGVPGGSWSLRASADGHVTNEPLVVHLDAGDEQRDLRIELLQGGTLAGLVVEEDGTPVRGADVVVKPARPEPVGGERDHLAEMGLFLGDEAGPDAPKRVTTDPQGRFEVRDLAPGRWLAQLSSGGGMSFGGGMGIVVMDGSGGAVDDPRSKAEAIVTAGEEAFVRLVRPPTATLTGQVLAGGRGVPDVTLKLKQAGSFMPFGGQTTTSDRWGNFTFEGVEPGRYELSGIVPKAANPETLEVELAAGRTETARLVFEGSTIAGQVLDDESGAGVADLLVSVNPVKKTGTQQRTMMMFVSTDSGGGGTSITMDAGGVKSRVTTDAEGRFEALYLEPGQYEIVVSGGGYAEARSEVIEVVDGQDKDGVEIAIGRGAVLTGRVVSGDTGQALDGVPVSLRALGERGPGQMTMTEAGAYRFEGLSPGDYDVSVMGSGFGGPPLASDSVSVQKGEVRTLDLRTTPQG